MLKNLNRRQNQFPICIDPRDRIPHRLHRRTIAYSPLWALNSRMTTPRRSKARSRLQRRPKPTLPVDPGAISVRQVQHRARSILAELRRELRSREAELAQLGRNAEELGQFVGRTRSRPKVSLARTRRATILLPVGRHNLGRRKLKYYVGDTHPPPGPKLPLGRHKLKYYVSDTHPPPHPKRTT